MLVKNAQVSTQSVNMNMMINVNETLRLDTSQNQDDVEVRRGSSCEDRMTPRSRQKRSGAQSKPASPRNNFFGKFQLFGKKKNNDDKKDRVK